MAPNLFKVVREMPKTKIRFYTERDSFGAEAAVIMLGLAIVFRLLGCWGFWQNQTSLIFDVAVPTGSALLFILLLVLLGKHALWSTFLPVLTGAAFFVYTALQFESRMYQLFYLMAAVLAALIWCCTVFRLIHTKWLLPPLFLAIFCVLMWRDGRILLDDPDKVGFLAGLKEMSTLCAVLGLFFASLAIKKLVKEPPATELPKVKDPVPVPPEQPKPETPAPAPEPGKAEPAPAPTPEPESAPAAPAEESAAPAGEP